jgi:molybdopterin-guanine dinucleotide biosynthesis protein A
MRRGSLPGVIGVVLAGGRGRRMGGAKPSALLAGRPLVAYPAEALAGVSERVAVVCKADTELPSLPGVERWDEPDEPRHPVAGIVFALERAEQPVLVCGADMPFVTGAVLESLAESLRAEVPAVVAVAGGRLQPVLAAYAPSSLSVLRAAAADEPLTRIVERLDPVRVEVPERAALSVDTPEDLAAAARDLERGRLRGV